LSRKLDVVPVASAFPFLGCDQNTHNLYGVKDWYQYQKKQPSYNKKQRRRRQGNRAGSGRRFRFGKRRESAATRMILFSQGICDVMTA
jgi:hypothetical protein